MADLQFINAICLLISFLSLHYFNSDALPVLPLSLIGAGIFLTQVFQRVSLKVFIFGFGLGAVVFYAAMNTAYELLQAKLIPTTIILPLASALIFQPRSVKNFLLIGLGLSLVTALSFYGKFRMVSNLELKLSGFEGAKRVLPTHYTPLILTDLIWAPKKKAYYILTNGTRFSLVAKRTKAGKKSPLFDTPYLLSRPKKVLIIGSAGGHNVSTALHYDPEEVVAVDINPEVFQIMNGRLLNESNELYKDPRVRSVTAEGRNFLESTHEKFDLIVMQGVQTGTHNSVSNVAVLESFLFTREALERLWTMLNPNGLLFLEEYKFLNADIDEDGPTLLGSLARISTDFFTENPLDHILYFQFPQDAGAPSAPGRPCEGLIIAKANIKEKEHFLSDQFPPPQLQFLSLPPNNEIARAEISDDSPFFSRLSNLFLTPLLVSSLALFLIITFIIYYRNRRQFKFQFGLFLIGISYIMFVMSVVGPATLTVGQPQLAVPIIYATLFLFGMIGGLFTLKIPNWCAKYGALFSSFMLILLATCYYFLKPFLLSIESTLLRVVALIIFVGSAAFVLELPYVGFLTRIESLKERTWGYSLAKLGVLVGMLLGVWVELHFGFSGAIASAMLIYFLTGILHLAK